MGKKIQKAFPKNFLKKETGFTLIELLVVISIMGILLALSVYGMQEARRASRDSKRRADIEQIRSALEMYRADCGQYPLSIGASIIGNGGPGCPVSNVYLSTVPSDPNSPDRSYSYSGTQASYIICAALEQAPSPSMDVTGCGNCGATCNYKVTNP
jgi:general secretion pathway protein G